MNVPQLEAATKSYQLWLDSGDADQRREWLLAYGFDDAKLQSKIKGLNKECEILRRSEYQSESEIIVALLYEDADKLAEIKAKRAEVDQKYPRVSLD
jgi:hypothetical protein